MAEKKEKKAKGGGEPKDKKKGKDAGSSSRKKKKGALEDKPRQPARLWGRYREELRVALKEELGLTNINQVPRLEKIVVNMGLGEAITNNKILDNAAEEIALITGQKPVITKARNSISNFKLREGMPIGVMVTLRRQQMWEFLDRLISIALPRVRDFKGISDKAFDGRGNYTLGIKEQIIFPEIDYDNVDKVRGMNICIVTTAENDVQGKALLRSLGVPLWKRETQQEQVANG